MEEPPTHYDDMTWSPSSKHFRSPGGSPQSYRRVIHPDDCDTKEEEQFFSGRNSPTFSRKIFRDVWDDGLGSNHRFADRPRLFKRVFKPTRWEDDDDDFERTRSAVRQIARDFDDDFEARKLERDFDSDFRHRDRDLKSDIEEEFEKAAGKVHHIPIMVERRLDEMRSRFGRGSPTAEKANYQEDCEDWQGPQVQRIKKNFERDNDFATLGRNRGTRTEPNKPRAFTSPIPSGWDPDNVHTLPIRRSSKTSKLYDEPQNATSPKSVYRSYSETHEDVPKQQQPHTAAFRSHSDGHCPKTTYVTKISVNIPSSSSEANESVPNGSVPEENNQNSQNCESSEDGWDSHQSRQRVRRRQREDQGGPESATASTNNESEQSGDSKPDTQTKKNEEKLPKDNKRSSLQQIAAVLQNVDDLLVHVESYNGTGRDKQFRFLDEMLTRCMLRLDDVDTEGREDIRSARKAAVMQVQSCIEKLESKADESERKSKMGGSQQQEVNENKDQTAPGENNDGAQSEAPQDTNAEQPQKLEDSEQTRL